MNSLLADLRRQREERQQKSDMGSAESAKSDELCTVPSGAKRRKQSVPRRIVRETEGTSDPPTEVLDAEKPKQSKKSKPASGSKEDSDAIDLTDSDVPAKKPRAKAKAPSKPQGSKKPRSVSAVEFDVQSTAFDPQELASEFITGSISNVFVPLT